MSKIFLSYAREDWQIASAVAQYLKKAGYSVWWDRKIVPGEVFDDVIAERLKDSDCVITIWSRASVRSDWVKDEAEEAKESGKLLPLVIKGCKPPFGFRRLQHIEVDFSSDHTTEYGLSRVVSAIPKFIGEERQKALSPEKGQNRHRSDGDVGSNPSVSQWRRSLDIEGDSVIVLSRLLVGFSVSVLAALAWGVGNALTRWTAQPFNAFFTEIAVLKVVSAALVLVVSGIIAESIRSRRLCLQRFWAVGAEVGKKPMAVIAKSVNTLLFVYAAGIIPAAYASTLENSHVVWTALILVMVLNYKIPKGWFAGSIIMLVGIALITEIQGIEFGSQQGLGILLAVFSGIAFSIFNLSWGGMERPSSLGARAVEMGLLLLLSGVTMLVVRILFGVLNKDFWAPQFFALPIQHIWVQIFNGLLGIGLTYWLINEAYALTNSLGRASSLLVGVGMSFAVVFTFMSEIVLFGQEVSMIQWLGVVAFSLGFASVRSELTRMDR